MGIVNEPPRSILITLLERSRDGVLAFGKYGLHRLDRFEAAAL